MDGFIVGFGAVANVITVVAGLVAIAGVGWAILGRAKLSFRTAVNAGPNPSLTVSISSTGSNPVRDVELAVGALDDVGFSQWGGPACKRDALNRGDTLTVIASESGATSLGSPRHDAEHRHPLEPGGGFYLNAQWRSPLFPWRRKSETLAWAPALRFASREPLRLKGRAESTFFTRAHDPQNNPAQPGYVRPKWAPVRGTVVSDDTFDSEIINHRGPVLVGFGADWQAGFWLETQRLLDALAACYAPRVRVLIVTVERCPVTASRYPSTSLPHFKVFRKGAVVASHVGAGSVPTLEAGLYPHLK